MNTDGNIPFCNPVTASAWERCLAILKPTPAQLQHGLELHQNLFVMDNFAFQPGGLWDEDVARQWNELKDSNVGARELATRMQPYRETAMTRNVETAHEFVAAIRGTGLKCIVQTVAGGKYRQDDFYRIAMNVHRQRTFRNTVVQVGTVEEIAEANAAGKVAIVWSMNSPPMVGELQELDQELSWIDTYYYLGIRMMHITYNRRNLFGDGCAEDADAGLSALGRDLIAKLNQTGIIVDVPHSGRQTTLEAAKCSNKPMMASHTAAGALFDYMRCKTDAELKAIADTDGLVGVYGLAQLLGFEANINTLLDHLDYIARLIGVEHVAIGTDNTYHGQRPKGVSGYPNARYQGNAFWGNWGRPGGNPVPPSDESSAGSLAWTNWPLYTVGLVMRGYSDEDIAKILGQNFLRVLKANEPEKMVRNSDLPFH